MSARPTTTGETAIGRSISAFMIRLPGNWCRTSSSATPTPKIALSSTDQNDTMAVILKACTTEGSASASRTGLRPFANVRQNTRPTGSTSRNSRYVTATRRSMILGETLATAGPPSLQDVEGDQHDQRDDEQHGRHRGGAGRVVGLDLAEDVDRGHLGLERQIARDQHG